MAIEFEDLIAHERRALDKKRGAAFFGLALSGGGIRSSTFGLGVLQHLATLGLLEKLDYLSTVSGGGYLGSWFAAWVKQANSIADVQAAMIPRPDGRAAKEEAEQIRWLRRFGKYLAPNSTLFSADTWTIVTLWLRNLLLNLVVLLVFLLGLIAFPWFVELGYQTVVSSRPIEFYYGHEALATVATFLAAVGSRRSGEMGKGRLGFWAGFLICVSTILYAFGPQPPNAVWPYIWGALLTGICAWGMMDQDASGSPRFLARAALGIALGGWAMGTAPPFVEALKQHDWPIFAPILVPAVISFCYCLLLTALMGLLGRHMIDERREWWSRVGAWMFIFGWAWVLLAGVALMGPSIVDFLRERYYIGIATGSLWAGLTAIGVYFGQSASSNGTSKSKSPVKEAVLPVIPVVFVTGLLILVASGLSYLVLERRAVEPLQSEYCEQCGGKWVEPDYSATWHNVRKPFVDAVQAMQVPKLPRDTFAKEHFYYWPFLLFAGFSGLYLLLSRLIDVNEFSMHRFYRNRLVRGFQGAARGDALRKADSFTNLDPKDDVRMLDLRRDDGYKGPVHLVNTAINLNLADTGLEERRAASFVFTPYGCGYTAPDRKEYCQRYPNDCELRLGTPVTASGAAASPNMGYHTSTTVAFLLTIFNVRLGYWIHNPKSASKWTPLGPKWGYLYFISELFGMASHERKYVYLSDGGHFENLAVYELLRRRCRYIICVDGEQDENMKFEGLAGLVRRARSDMGIEIVMETADIEERSAEGWSKSHCAVGRIVYPGSQPEGRLLYLKLSVTGDEPVDVLNYRKANAAFPHQTTGDQFFNESQFESYRRLGHHVAQHAFRPAETERELESMFEVLRDAWSGSPRVDAENFTRQVAAFDALMKELGTEVLLEPLQSQLNPKWPGTAQTAALSAAQLRVCFPYCQRLIQLMENVYVDLDLESNYDSPAYSGWMELFKDWKQSAILANTYEASRHIYSKQFANFYAKRLNRRP